MKTISMDAFVLYLKLLDVLPPKPKPVQYFLGGTTTGSWP